MNTIENLHEERNLKKKREAGSRSSLASMFRPESERTEGTRRSRVAMGNDTAPGGPRGAEASGRVLGGSWEGPGRVPCGGCGLLDWTTRSPVKQAKTTTLEAQFPDSRTSRWKLLAPGIRGRMLVEAANYKS